MVKNEHSKTETNQGNIERNKYVNIFQCQIDHVNIPAHVVFISDDAWCQSNISPLPWLLSGEPGIYISDSTLYILHLVLLGLRRCIYNPVVDFGCGKKIRLSSEAANFQV